MLRGLAVACIALAVIATMLAFVPSVEHYRSVDDCWVRTLEHVASLDSTPMHCEAQWSYVATTPPVSRPFDHALLFFTIAVPGLLVLWRPRARIALAWSAFALVTSCVWFVATFALRFDDLFQQIVRLPAAYAYDVTATALVAIVIAGVPLACLFVRRRR
jgi:hypothetical protein